MRERRKNTVIIGILCGLLLIMSVGYATFQSILKINGTTSITSNWDIKIINVTKANQTGDAEEAKAPIWTDLTAYMEANLYQKGDSIEYNVTVKNNGTIDAKLDNINKNIKTQNEALLITISGYTKGEKLLKGNEQIIKVKIEYNPEFTGTITEGSAETSIDLNYAQAEGGTIVPTNDYLLTFDYQTNGGTYGPNESYYSPENESIDLSETADKEGYEFVGWNTNKDAKEGLETLNMPSQNTTLYAIFRKGLSVSYTKDNGISSIGKENETCYLYNNDTNCELTLPSITAPGYTIQGWYNGETKVGNAGDKININQNITLTAKAVDDIKPSAPTITNSSNGDWTSNDVIITLESTDEGSGIDRYEWYENDAWTTRALTTSNEQTTITYTVNRNETIRFRAIDKEGNISNESTTQVKIDKNAPTLSVATSKTTKSITVVATASATSGITKYEFSNDGGNTWVNNGTNKTYTFNNLDNTKSYPIQVRVTSGIGKTTTSASTSVQPNAIAVPTYKETGTTTKTVTITYPSGCGSAYTCTYKKDSAAAVNVTSTTANVSFTASGTLSGTVSDGKNTVSSSYTPTIKYGLSAGTVRGGSISLSKTLASYTETITFTATPSSGFTYQGATIVCNNSTSQTINSSTKSFKVSNTGCSQATVYPTWKKDDLTIFELYKISGAGKFSGNLFDGARMDINYNENLYYYFFEPMTTDNARGQITSTSSYSLDDYSKISTYHYCHEGVREAYLMLGVVSSRSSWVHEKGNYTSKTIPAGGSNPALELDISKLTGNYYIGVQLLSNYQYLLCDVDYVKLTGKTYNYTNRS